MADERPRRRRRPRAGGAGSSESGRPNQPEQPVTDEFGRSDPETSERELRRRKREQQRATTSQKGSAKRGANKKSASKRGASKRDAGKRGAADPERASRTTARSPRSAEGDNPAPARRRAAQEPQAAGSGGLAGRAAAGRDSFRRRFGGGGSGGDPGTYRRRQTMAILGVLGGILAIWFLVALFQPFAGDGEGEGTVRVEIPEGTEQGEIADILDDAGVISSATLFEWRVWLAGEKNQLQHGDYSLARGMSYSKVIERLTGATEGQISLVIPEGLSRDQVAEVVSGAGISGDYEAATASSPGFNPAKYGAKDPANLEGFLFPATYELDAGATVEDLVPMQLDAFEQNLKGVDMSYAKKKNLTPYDVLIIASMIDREVMVPKERELVAAVIYNRLSDGTPLGIDATTRFETGNFEEPLTNDQLQTDSPYNTRTRAGLPPGPIGNPGIDAIEAAARPANVPFLFYVVKPGTCGEHTFVKTEAEFEEAVAAYNAAREEAGGQSPTEC